MERRHWRLGNARGLTFVLFLILGWQAFGEGALSPAWLSAPVVLFVYLAVVHERVLAARAAADQAAGWNERGLERLDHQWPGKGNAGERYADSAHLYSADLDLFGHGSLFELLDVTRTRGGSDALARWLLAPADAATICERQAAVRELQPRLVLREEISLLGDKAPRDVDFASLGQWGSAPRRLNAAWPRWVGGAISLLSVAALIFALAGGSASPFLVSVIAVAGLNRWLARDVESVVAAVDRRANELDLLADLFRRLEGEPVSAARLLRLRAALQTAGEPPSRRIARLRALLDLLDSRRNILFAPIAVLLLWTMQFAYAIEDWRQIAGPAVNDWLAALAEWEALSALAGYAFDNPDRPFAEIVSDPAAGPLVEGIGLAHPLLPCCVANDLSLGVDLRLLIVSGSNMSGKSTFLRTVGVNVVLATAGAPVRARSLRLSPLCVGGTLRIQDSLQQGRSRFFAEITRIRQLLDQAKRSPPLLFLVDEVLHGTNSQDRRVGAAAVVRTLLDRGAIGLLTTHDLALTPIADELAPQVRNVHFADAFDGGGLTFDYKMRPGVVPQSNAIALMRAVGIDV